MEIAIKYEAVIICNLNKKKKKLLNRSLHPLGMPELLMEVANVGSLHTNLKIIFSILLVSDHLSGTNSLFSRVSFFFPPHFFKAQCLQKTMNVCGILDLLAQCAHNMYW